MHTAHFGTDTVSSLGPKLWKLIPDKIKYASTLSAFKAKIKSWTINDCPCRLRKYLLRILVLLKFVQVSSGIHTNAYSFFKYTYNHTKKLYNCKYDNFKKFYYLLVLHIIRGVF